MLKLIVGIILGLPIIPVLLWTIFVYPDSEINLKKFYLGLIIGIVISFLLTSGILIAWAVAWPKD